MATLFTKSNGTRGLQFYVDEVRKTIRLGPVTRKSAELFRLHVEHLLNARLMQAAAPSETAQWLGTLPDETHDKLAKAGLVKARERSKSALKAFVDGVISGRTDIGASTKRWYTDARDNLVACFGANTTLRDIGPADADKLRLTLEQSGLGDNTIRRRIGMCRQIFNVAQRYKLIDDNPFLGMATDVRSNPDKFRFVTQAETKAIIENCPDATWRAIVCLVRYGGLRCPSEVLSLKWGHVDWGRSRLTVPSPKTSHHEGKASRVIPLFPEIRLALEDAFTQAEEGQEYIIQRYRGNAINLRTSLEKIIVRAGVTPWPKLFVNLRSSRETELVKDFPIHTVTAWLGNSPKVAMKHYLQVVDADFDKAVCIVPQATSNKQETMACGALQKALQSMPAPARTDANGQTMEDENHREIQGNSLVCTEVHNVILLGTGIEPALLSEPEPKSGASANSATRAGSPNTITDFL